MNLKVRHLFFRERVYCSKRVAMAVPSLMMVKDFSGDSLQFCIAVGNFIALSGMRLKHMPFLIGKFAGFIGETLIILL